jgi:hypothetical protein
MGSGEGKADKARDWQRTIQEAVQGRRSIEGFCRQRQLEGRLYWPQC